MRMIVGAPLWAGLIFLAAIFPVWAQSPLAARFRAWATRYHENPQKIDELRTALESAAGATADLDTLLALSQACFIYGDVRAKTPGEKKGRTAEARRKALAVLDEMAPSNPADWTVKDVPQVHALLEQIQGRS